MEVRQWARCRCWRHPSATADRPAPARIVRIRVPRLPASARHAPERVDADAALRQRRRAPTPAGHHQHRVAVKQGLEPEFRARAARVPPNMSRSPASVRMPVRSSRAAICRIGARQTVPDANCWAARPELTEPHTKRAPPCQRRRRAASQCGYSLTAPATRRTPLTLRHRAARAEEPAGLLFNGANQHLVLQLILDLLHAEWSKNKTIRLLWHRCDGSGRPLAPLPLSPL